MKITASKKNYIVVGFALLFFFGLVSLLTYFQISQLQNIQSTSSKASSQIAEVFWGDFPGSINNNESLTIPVYINSKQYSLSAIQVKGRLNNIAADKVKINSSKPQGLVSVISRLKEENGATTFTLVYFSDIASSSLFSTSSSNIKIADINISGLSNGNYSVNFDGSKSYLTSFLFPDLVLGVAGDKSFSVSSAVGGSSDNDNNDGDKKSCNQNCATDTECKSDLICYKGQCRSEKDKEDSECVPDRGISRVCNEYCADSNECSSEFTCYYNRCRNPLNLLSEACALPTPKPTAAAQTVTAAKGDIKATPKPTPVIMARVIIDATTAAKVLASPTPKPTPRPTLRPSPSPTIEPTTRPAPILIEEDLSRAESREKGPNIWLRVLMGTLVIGFVGAAGFIALYYWKPKMDSF